MCLILFSYRRHPQFRLLAAANRDEFYDRPTAPAGFWPERPELLAGRDLKSGGTWLGVTRTGRFAALTNYRDPSFQRPDAPSRGDLVSGFLKGAMPAADYMAAVAAAAERYNGFNLLAADRNELYWFCNRAAGVRRLPPGVYGLSNRVLDTPWPKVAEGKKALEAQLTGADPFDPEAVFSVLADRSRPADDRLPDTGMGLAWERILSSRFIVSDIYGTRSATVLAMGEDGHIRFWERTFFRTPEGVVPGDTREFAFSMVSSPEL